ncbi:MAG: GNAT family N-acetyltransferase [Proteobacteria bacterium]|nr:GNAT family N-acetyltransferase [Pseudomonadota bacterium]
MKEFVTERLRLRGWRRDDAPALAAMNADPEVMRYIGSGAKLYAEALERAESLVRERPGDGLGLWAIEESATGVFHGWAGLIPLDDTEEIELAYRLAKSSWGRGIATEAARPLLAYGFDELRLARIAAVTDPENRASRRVLDKLGFLYQGLRSAYGVEGCCYYTLAEAAWRTIEAESFDSTTGP